MNKHDPGPKPREASLFKSNRSQAVRIPKDLAFPDGVKTVTITPTDDGGLIIKPQKKTRDWAAYFREGPHLSEDFLVDRDQGVAEEREPLDQ